MNLTGAELIFRYLEDHSHAGVAVVGGGPALEPLELALEQSSLRCSEPGAADVLLFDYRCGLASAAGLLAGAKAQRKALLCIAVQVQRSLIGSGAFQPAQTRRMLDPLTKQWFHVGAANELVELLPQAWQLARSGRRGPVLLEVPQDVLPELVQGIWMPPPVSARATQSLLPA